MSERDNSLVTELDSDAVKDACDWYLLTQYLTTPTVINSEEAAVRSGRTAGAINRQIQRMKKRAPLFNVHTSNDTSSLNAIEGAVGKWANKRDEKVAKAAAVKKEKGTKKVKGEATDGQADDKTVAGGDQADDKTVTKGNGKKRKATTGGGRRVKKTKADEEEVVISGTADDKLGANTSDRDATHDWTEDGNADEDA